MATPVADAEVSVLRLYALRALYLLMALGLGLAIWPRIVVPLSPGADRATVTWSLLGAIGLLATIGLRYPLKMIPLLLFEFSWKAIWILAFAARTALAQPLDDYARQTLFECLPALVLIPLLLPWGYLRRHYLEAPADPWRSGSAS